MEVIKIAVIHNDGKIDYVTSDVLSDAHHISLMLDYVKEHYKDDNYLNSCDIHVAVNKIAMYLCSKGEIVYIDTTTYKKDVLTRHGKRCIFLMPKVLKEIQMYNLFKLKDMISDFNEVQIWYNIKSDSSASMQIGDSEIITEFVKGRRLKRRTK